MLNKPREFPAIVSDMSWLIAEVERLSHERDTLWEDIRNEKARAEEWRRFHDEACERERVARESAALEERTACAQMAREVARQYATKPEAPRGATASPDEEWIAAELADVIGWNTHVLIVMECARRVAKKLTERAPEPEAPRGRPDAGGAWAEDHAACPGATWLAGLSIDCPTREDAERVKADLEAYGRRLRP